MLDPKKKWMSSYAWEEGYLDALRDVKEKVRELSELVDDLAEAIIYKLPEGDGDAETRSE